MKHAGYIIILVIIIVIIIPLAVISCFPISDGRAENQNKDDTDQKIQYESSSTISVYIEEEDKTVELPLEEYVTGVVASEMAPIFEVEALKAQAVAARTYGLARAGGLCNTVHCQVYQSEEQIRQKKGDKWMNTYWNKLKNAVYATEGQVMYYDGALAGQVLFHSSSGGRTENSEDVFVMAVPYLRSVSSPYEQGATHRNDSKTFTIEQFNKVLNGYIAEKDITLDDVKNMQISARTVGGCVAALTAGAHTFTGRQIRKYFDLESANFEVKIDGTNVIVTSIGYGHGVGMSQYGANGMAQKGYTYDKILKHYYTGIEIRHLESPVIQEASQAS